MAIVIVVVVGAAVLVTRTTEDYLIKRVDAQLASIPLRGDGGGPDEHGGPGPIPNLNSVWVGEVSSDGTVVTRLTPSHASADLALPKISKDQAIAALQTRKAFTVGTEPSSSTRYRVRSVGGGSLL